MLAQLNRTRSAAIFRSEHSCAYTETLWSTEVGKHREIDSELADASDEVYALDPRAGLHQKERTSLYPPHCHREIERQSLQSIALIEAECEGSSIRCIRGATSGSWGKIPVLLGRKCDANSQERRIAHGTECINLMQCSTIPLRN